MGLLNSETLLQYDVGYERPRDSLLPEHWGQPSRTDRVDYFDRDSDFASDIEEYPVLWGPEDYQGLSVEYFGSVGDDVQKVDRTFAKLEMVSSCRYVLYGVAATIDK